MVKRVEGVQVEAPSGKVRSAVSTDKIAEPRQEIIRVDNSVKDGTFERVTVTSKNADEVRNSETRAGTVRIDNIAVQGGKLVQISCTDDNDIPLRSWSAEEEVPHISIRSHSPSNEEVLFELSDREVQRKGSDEGYMLDQEFVIDSIADHVFENESCLFRVTWCKYSLHEDTGEPTEHFPRWQIVMYLRRRIRRLSTPRTLSKAMPG